MLDIITVIPGKKRSSSACYSGVMLYIPTTVINITTRSFESMYYLYVKTHNKTGLKYLGKTTRDPDTYRGSGIRWINHINLHGYDVTTEILLVTTDKHLLREKGEYYSTLWNVVGDYNWANLIPESGDGGDTSEFINYKETDQSFRKDIDYLVHLSDSCRQAWKNKFLDETFDEAAYKKMCSERTTRMWESRGISDEERLQRSRDAKENYIKDPSLKNRLSTAAKQAWEKKPRYYEVTHPNGSKEKIKFLRRWCKENNINYHLLYNTIRRNKPSHDGWFVREVDV